MLPPKSPAEAIKLLRRGVALSRVANPANNAAEQERITASRCLEETCGCLADWMEAAAKRAKRAKRWPTAPRPSPAPAPPSVFAIISKEWAARFTKSQVDPKSLRTFIRKGLGEDDLREAIGIAADRIGDEPGAWRYFCGVCWNKIRGHDDLDS